MTNEEAIRRIKDHMRIHKMIEPRAIYIKEALELAINALERDCKVDDITLHWNDEKSTFVAACSAFEDILKVYGRGEE